MSATRAQSEKDKGNAAFKAGDYPTAIGHYSAAVVADPQSPTYPLNRAAAYLKLGKNEDAERDCTTVLRLDAKNVKAMFRRGQARVALERLKEARDDFQKALVLEPSNDAVKQELKKAEDALKAHSKPRAKHPVDVSAAPAISGKPKPQRRRIPIEIIESPATASTSTKTATGASNSGGDFMTPLSSRPLSSTPSPAASTPSVPASSPQPKPAPHSFQEAKEAKEARSSSRPGGGIFRSNGQHTLFGEKSASETPPAAPTSTPVSTPTPIPVSAPTSTPVSVPTADGVSAAGPSTGPANGYPLTTDAPEKAKAPITLFAFTKQWEKTRSSEERWRLLNAVPPAALPALFQASLDAALLAGVLSTLRDALRAAPEEEMQARVRAYMQALPRVPRFGTVVLFMSDAERGVARDVWELLGGGDERAWGRG